ncbi:hypothetical protein [Streptomyces sparsogenes]|uniref:Acyl-CoA dehydrogenase n=1 Tax=Streptomyces sparsogenes DSM 40356 TaxID=1331668 RepID=A0A1R1SBJ1_9ACTN|nr:acyl-CoA dehydrogenase [Streptomyces sparsogenes DSM 40356]
MPRSHGGAEVSAHTLGEVVRLRSAADASIGQIPQNHFFSVEALKENGTAVQRDFFYSELLAGRRFGNALAEKGHQARAALEFATRLAPRPDGSYTLTRHQELLHRCSVRPLDPGLRARPGRQPHCRLRPARRARCHRRRRLGRHRAARHRQGDRCGGRHDSDG